MKPRHYFFGRLLLPAAVLISFSGIAMAANLWDGGGGNANWTTALNWDDNNTASSGSGNNISFGGVIGLNSINDYTGYTAWQNILFNSGAGSFNLTSTTGANWDLYGKIENNSTNAQSIAIDAISLKSATANEFDATLGNLTITAKDIYTNGNNLTFWGARTLTVNNGGGSGISQGGKVILGSSFTGTAILAGSNSYTGNTEINSGILKVANSSGLGASTVFVGNGGATGTPATLLLTGSGLSVGNNLNTNAGTNSNRIIGGDNTSGTNTFTGTLAMASGGSATLTAAAGGNVAFTGVISGTGQGITKAGPGTVTLSAANSYTGNTTVNSGTLKLDFTAAGAPSGATGIITGSVLKLGGGKLQIVGASGGSTQTFTSTSFTAATGGLTIISAAPVSGTNPLVNLGTLAGTQGAMVRFDGAAYNSGASSGTTLGGTAVAATANFTATTNTMNGGLIAVNTATLSNANNTAMAYATVGLYDWAAISGAGAGTPTSTGTIVGASQNSGFYTTTNALSTTGSFGLNIDLTASSTMFGNANVSGAYSTIRFNAAGAVTLTTAKALGGSVVGALLVTPNVGANNITIATGSSNPLQASRSSNAATGLTIWQNNTLGELLFNAVYANGSSSAATGTYTQGGAGTVLLSAVNTYSGQSYLNGGTTVITANSGIGAIATGATVNINGGTLFGNATFTLDNAGANKRGVFLNGAGGTLAASAGNTMTVTGVISGTAPLSIGTGTIAGTGAGTANATAVIGSGTVTLTGPNSHTGGTTINAGTLNINGINALGGAVYGGLTLNGGTLQYATAFSGNGSGDLTSIGSAGVTIASGNGTIDVNGNAVTYAGSIGNGGTGALTVKSSAANGSLTLGSANTYTGGTTISSGVLNITNTAGSATGTGAVSLGAATLTGTGTLTGSLSTVASSTIAPGASGAGVLTLGDVTLVGSTTINYGLVAGTPTANYISAGALTLPSSGTVLLNLYAPGTSTPFAAAGTYDLFKYTSLAGGSFSSAFSFGTSITGYTPSFATSGGFLQLILTAAGVNGSWTNGTANSNWTDSGNWTGGVPSLAGSTATFASAPGAVTLDANETVGSITFNNASAYTLSGGNTLTMDNSSAGASIFVTNGAHVIQSAVALNDTTTASVSAGKTLTISGNISNTSGSKSLLVNGAGTVVLSGDNTYGPSAGSIGTTLSAGTLQVGSNTALGAGDLAVTAASSLQAGGGVSLANAVGITNGVTLTADSQANTFTLGGVISDNAGAGGGTAVLSKIGSGTLVLNGANTYGGGTMLTAGTLQINSSSSLGASTGNLTFNGGTLQLGATVASTTRNYVVNSGKTATIDTNGFDLTTSGVISSVGTTTGSNVDGLAKNGSGNLTLGTANTFTGQTVVNGGTLTLGTALALQTSTLNYAGQGGSLSFGALTAATLGGLTGSQALALTNNSSGNVALTVGGTNIATTFTGNLSGGGSFSKVGTATTTLSNATYTGNTVVYNGGLTLNGSTSLTTHLDITAQQGIATVLIDGATVNATGGLYITSATGGSGTIFGNRASLTINNGAQVTVGADGNGRAISYGMGNGRPSGNGTLTIGATGDTTTSVTANGVLDMFYTSGGGTIGNFTVNLDGGTLAVQNIKETTFGGNQTGTFKFNGGVLKALQSTTTFLPATTGLTASVLAGGAKINTDGFDVTVGSVLASGVANDGGLTKTGAGALTLSNTNTYNGPTTIKAGTLTLDATGTIAASTKIIVGDAGSSETVLDVSAKTGGFTIGSTQKLSGIGTIDANDAGTLHTVTVQGTHAVGNSPGSQAVDGNLAYASGSIFEWDLAANKDTDGADDLIGATGDNGVAGTDYDAVTVMGTLNIDSAAVFKVIQNTGADFGTAFWTSNQTWSNIFNVTGSITSGWSNAAVAVYNTSYVAQDVSSYGSFTINGSTLTWSAVPEPTSALAGLLIGAGLLRRRRSA